MHHSRAGCSQFDNKYRSCKSAGVILEIYWAAGDTARVELVSGVGTSYVSRYVLYVLGMH